MKKIFTITLAALAAVAIFVGCDKEIAAPGTEHEQVTPSSGKVITISAKLAESLTKVSFTPDVDGSNKAILKLKWESGDKLIVANHDDTSSYAEFSLVSGAGEAEAVFSGTLPSGASSYDVSIKHGAVSYDSIEQEADNDTAHLDYVAAKKGITDLDSIVFDEICGVLGITAKLPDDVTATVRSVSVVASESIFNSGKELNFSLNTPGDEGGDDILRLYAPLPVTSQGIPAGITLLIRFNDRYTRLITLPASTLTPGKLNEIKVNCSKTDKHAGAVNCDGTSADNAYLIGDKYQLQAVNDLMVEGGKRYFKLIDNITLGDTWTSLNPSPFTKQIDLDGNGKTIYHLRAPLFADFNGEAKNFIIFGADVSMSALAGIFACSVKTAASTVNNVDITASSLDASTSYCGGLIGQADFDIQLSGVNVTETDITGGLAGGVIGYPTSTASISECSYEDGTITSKAQYTGGIVAATASGKTTTVSDCSVKNATLTSAYHRMGGAIGAMRNGTTVQRTTVGESEHNVIVTSTGTAACYVGGFIGLMEGGEVKDNCVAYVTLTGVKTSIGGFIGRMTAGKISGCKSYGSVSGPGTIGGFLGDVTGATEIKNNESNCSVTATSTYVGGFVGQFKGSLSCSGCKHKSGKVWSNLGGGTKCYIGGFAGYIGTESEAFTGTISNCLVTDATIDAVKYKDDGKTADSSGAWVGGFAGGIGHSTYSNNTGTVQLCRVHNTPVSGGTYCGGFAGVSYAAIEKCGVSGKKTVQCYGNSDGGFLGYQQGHFVRYCYSNAKVRHSNKSNVGGLIGNAKNTSVEECYSAGDVDNSTSNSSSSTTWGGVIGLSTSNTFERLIRWNDSNTTDIVAGTTPSGSYVKTSGDSSFQTIASSLGWSTDGSVWDYSGETPSLVGMP